MFCNNAIKPIYFTIIEINTFVNSALVNLLRLLQSFYYEIFLIKHTRMFNLNYIFPISLGGVYRASQGCRYSKENIFHKIIYTIIKAKSQISSRIEGDVYGDESVDILDAQRIVSIILGG